MLKGRDGCTSTGTYVLMRLGIAVQCGRLHVVLYGGHKVST